MADSALTRNAAHLLADLLESLVVPPNTHPQSVHGFESETDIDAWREHVERLNLARTVDDHVRTLALTQNAGVFESSVPHWYAGIGFATTPWDMAQNQRHRAACPPEHLNMLRALAMVIDATPHLEIREEDRRSLLDVIAEARTLLDEDTSMAQDVRLYLAMLLQRAAFLLDNLEKYGAEPIRAVALELGGAMYTQAQREPEEGKKSRWSAAAWGFVTGFLSRSGVNSADALAGAAEAGLKAIGGG
ncbi:hypothetical protein [Pimelobacter simplex]|uniref:hypothetical protein n=1 Tax=Nocardioides simplex TaxID=2045 RepID=UPI0021503E69|nr:hypothetical protein [Pimelobacter simplex]UUW88451.1 hypothetical protein M0M43_22290 [Pimelobacter simplex]UUW97955.1 hypothetical protein M0M48_10935 [Pimelobacter simplex]